jgi:hypothetical protein
VRRIRCPVLYMRTDQPKQRPRYHNHDARELDGGVAFSSSFAWWETHLSCSRGPRTHASTTAVLRHQSQCRDDNAQPFDRSTKTNEEPVDLTVLPIRAPIMKVAARHEAQSKMDDPPSGSWERCRWPHTRSVPEVHSGSLRWQK